MLDAVAELTEHAVGDVQRVLADEIHAHAFGANQAHHLLDLLHQRGGGVVEHQMRFVEKQHQLGQRQIAAFRQHFKEFGQKPQHKGAVQARRADQFFGVQYIDHAAAAVGLQPVGQIEFGFAEKALGAFALKLQQLALDGADAGGGNIAVAFAVFGGMLRHILQHAAQVFQIDQVPAFVVGHFENDIEQPFLGVVQIHQPRQEHRPHLRHAHAHRNAGFAVHIPKAHGKTGQIVRI